MISAKSIGRFLNLFSTSSLLRKEITSPRVIQHRNQNQKTSLIFVHGFCGSYTDTWDKFIKLLISDPSFSDWDIHSVGYQTGLSIELAGWARDPDIKVCAKSLETRLNIPPFSAYEGIALIAHSMGGLVAQQAIIGCNALQSKLTHCVLFGTPSNGLLKAHLGSFFKRQSRDMGSNSDFILRLRNDWSKSVGINPPFTFISIAGDTDDFVPASSSLGPFPENQQAVISGNHLQIIRPSSITEESYILLANTISRTQSLRSTTESARLALEHKRYQEAIDLLSKDPALLDANAIVTLALALESVGRNKEALKVISDWNAKNKTKISDPMGVLAGRLKRRWKQYRNQHDFDKAFSLYTDGYECSAKAGCHEQAYYHAINLAFLHLVGPSQNIGKAEQFAEIAFKKAQLSEESQWTWATKGEAHLILKNKSEAIDCYEQARGRARTLRDCDSMYIQASEICECLYPNDEDFVSRLNSVFVK